MKVQQSVVKDQLKVSLSCQNVPHLTLMEFVSCVYGTF